MLKLACATSLCLPLFLSGCVATGYMIDNYMGDRPAKITTLKQPDKMLAIGQVQGSGNEQGMLFLGENYSYLITQGGEQLLKLIQQVPPEQRILHNQLPIIFHVNQKDNTFEGELQFRYPTPSYLIEYEQLKKIEALGFNDLLVAKIGKTKRAAYQVAKIKFKGKIYQSVKPNQIQYQLSQAYPISLQRSQIKQRKESGLHTLTGLILTPLAITFDIVTFPIIIVAAPIAIGVALATEDNPWQ
ncbi:YidX family protein [Acinetobacter cumulans]|nr:hypothetical protein [Acinetobacter cumulans]